MGAGRGDRGKLSSFAPSTNQVLHVGSGVSRVRSRLEALLTHDNAGAADSGLYAALAAVSVAGGLRGARLMCILVVCAGRRSINLLTELPNSSQRKESINMPKQARDGATYTRQQKGHSVTAHVFLNLFTGGLALPWTIYYAVSPNHFYHA